MPASKHKKKKKHQKKEQPPHVQTHGEGVERPSDSPLATVPTGIQKKDESDGESMAGGRLPYKIQHSDIMGRYLVASRKLDPGEIIIKERPLAIGPCVSGDPVCLGCYKPVKLLTTQYRCPGCQWPLCNANCRGLHKPDGHTEEECQVLKNQGPPLASSTTPVKNFYELILIIRILLLREYALEKYTQILTMESHLSMRQENTELWQYYQQNVVERLQRDWHLTNYTELEIHKICGIIDVNCFEIGQNSFKARTLYPNAFLLAHDCTPNTAHTDDPDDYSIIIRSSTRVHKNKPITLSYAYTLQGTLKRRDFMYAGKLFWCKCKRCTDPTELGTDCSAIICAQCSKGLLRSTDPLDQKADWSCDKCNYHLSAEKLLELLDKINADLESVDVHDIPSLENFLQRYSEVLAPNHYLLLSAKYSLCQIYGRIDGYLLHNMTLEDIKRKERYCREFLTIINVLEPGLTRLRGLIMYELHAPIMVRSQHMIQTEMISRQDFHNNIKTVINLLRESADILCMEPKGSNEHEMGLAATDALLKITSN